MSLPVLGRAGLVPVPQPRTLRLVPLAVIVLVGSWLLFVALFYIVREPRSIGYDYAFYRDVGARWLADGTYYLPYQTAGPYSFTTMLDVLYPPTGLFLFVPFAVLPAVLWWLIPAAITGYVIWSCRPNVWTVALILLLLAWPKATNSIVYGNTDIWMMATVAGGLRWGWPALFLLIKPTLAIFALVGIRHRSWWVGLAVLVVVSLLQLPLWLDYVVAMRNLAIHADYSLVSIPMLLIPIVAWVRRPLGALSGVRVRRTPLGRRLAAAHQ